MDASAFIDVMLDTLQRDEPLSMDMPLSDVPEWDSLAAMAFLALADRKFGKKLSMGHLKSAQTVSDLHALLEN
jgi:Phosphopantetheine attachment site.